MWPFKKIVPKPFKPIGYVDYVTSWTREGKETGDTTTHRVILKMNEDGDRKAEYPKYKDYTTQKSSLDNHPMTTKIMAWEVGGPLPTGLIQFDDDQVIELLNNILKRKMGVPNG